MATGLVLIALAIYLHRNLKLRLAAKWLAGLVVLQVATGLSNVVLGWPLVAAVLHTGGAGALVTVLVWLLAGSQSEFRAPTVRRAASLQPEYSE
jgi:cytochrome c oxidase assembly protein subunit 15